MRRQIANKRGEKEKGNNSWRWGSTWRVQSRPEWAPASVVLLMSASAHLITAIPKSEMGYLAVISPKHSPQAQLKSEKHNSPPSLSVFFSLCPRFFFFSSFLKTRLTQFFSLFYLPTVFESTSHVLSRLIGSGDPGLLQSTVCTVYTLYSIWAIFVYHCTWWSGLGSDIYSCMCETVLRRIIQLITRRRSNNSCMWMCHLVYFFHSKALNLEWKSELWYKIHFNVKSSVIEQQLAIKNESEFLQLVGSTTDYGRICQRSTTFFGPWTSLMSDIFSWTGVADKYN